MTEDILKIKETIVPILLNANVTKSSLFGSYVRGEQNNESDIDLLIELPLNKSLFDFIDLKLKLEDSLNKKVDLVEYDSIKPAIRTYILNEQIQII